MKPLVDVDAIATALYSAERHQTPIEPPSDQWPELNVDDAYRIQMLNVRRRLNEGRVVRGHKVGLTSVAMQEMLGVSEPDYGHLFDDRFVADGANVGASQFCRPRIEPEVAFVLGRALQGPDCRPEDVIEATEWVCPALEIIDSRVVDWRITLADTIADNASSGAVVLGGQRRRPAELDLRNIDVLLIKNGEPVATGSSGAVLSDPAVAVAWLINKLHEYGAHMEAEQVVMPGSCTRAVDVAAGDTVRAEFVGFSTVSVTFTEDAT